MKNEEWRDVVGYEGRYQVSSMGRVKSLKWNKERILKPITDHYGYRVANLYTGGKRKTLKVHRLVCEAFQDNPENKSQVNHINEDKTDNRARNLEWATARENSNFGTRNERIGKKLAIAKSRPIAQYTLNGKLLKVWPSAIEVQRQAGFSQGNIWQVANGNRKTAHGFIWRYVERKEKI